MRLWFQVSACSVLYLNGRSKFKWPQRNLCFAAVRNHIVPVQKRHRIRVNAVQCVMQGKLPITLINPTVLQNILRNVSLHIPEGYKLIVGVRTENIYLYYKLVYVSIATIPHCIKLIISVPLKTANYYFTLYKIITLPEHVSSEKFSLVHC